MTGPDPSVALVRAAVRNAVADLPPAALVLVACSGGADSLALAACAAFVGPRAGLRTGAVVVDHGLQPGSSEVAERVRSQLLDLGLDPVVVETVRVGTSGGPEAAARDARYGALSGVAERLGASAVLLGHTLDDQAETVLLGLARGSGARSLSGMAVRSGVLRRPLLDVRRTQTVQRLRGPWPDAVGGPPQRRSALRPGARPPRGAAHVGALPRAWRRGGPGAQRPAAPRRCRRPRRLGGSGRRARSRALSWT